MSIAEVMTQIGSFVTIASTNKVLSSVVILLIAAAIGSLAFRTIKRFVK